MHKERIEIIKRHILRRFLNKTIIGMSYINRQDVKVKKIGGDVVQKAIDDLIKEGYLETHHKYCISINSKMLKVIGEYIDKN